MNRRVRPGQTLLGDSVRASVAAAFGNAPGFLVPIAIAMAFGASGATDAFFLALAVASLIATALGAATQHAAIPFLVGARRDSGDIGAFVAEMTAVLLVVALIPTVAIDIGVRWYIGASAGWNSGDLGALSVLLACFIPYVAASVVAGVYSGSLNAEHRFVRVALSPAIRWIIILIAVAFSSVLNVYALVIGYVAGEGARLWYLYRAVNGLYRVVFLRLPDPRRLASFCRVAVAQMLGSGILAFTPLLDRLMATRLGPGSVSVLDYTDRLWQLPIGLAMAGFMVTSLSHWSENIDTDAGLQRLASETRRVALFAALTFLGPCIVFLVFRTPIVHLVLGHSKLRPDDLSLLARMLSVLVVGTPLYIAGLTYTRAFLVLKRSDLLLAIATVQVVAKLVLNLLLMPVLGLVGIAAATTVMFAASSIMMFVVFHRWLVHRRTPAALGPSGSVASA